MIGVDRLIEKLNTLISGGSLTELEVTQLSKVVDTLEKKGVSSVLSAIYLPNVVENKGRLFWLQTEQRYVYSNGVGWDVDYLKKYYVNLWSWGINNVGHLGDGTTTSRRSPVTVVEKITDWVQASAAGAHTLALRANGTAWAWGINNGGRLGDNTVTSRLSPVSVVGGFTDWILLSAGAVNSLGLRANGTAWSWGYNEWGQIGDGTTVSKISPVSVVGGFTDWVSLSSGGRHSLGLRANGTAWAWGRNNYGQLGDNTTSNRSSPVSVVGGYTDWISVDVGESHSLGLRANGTLWAWGFNDQGRLGDNTITSRISPVSVVGGFTDWIAVSAAGRGSLGLRANGTAWAWGRNAYGQVGDNTITSRSSPVSIVGGFTDWVSVGGMLESGIGLRSNGTLWTWGRNTAGQLGDNTTSNRSSPVSVVGGFTDWISHDILGSTSAHALGIRAV